jgi:hypothetical protein
MVCEETLSEWQGVAVCEVCDWNENGSDGPHGGRAIPNTPAEDNSDRRAAEIVDDDVCPTTGEYGPWCECMYCDAADWSTDPTCCDPTEGGCPECDPIAFPSYADLVGATRCRHGIDSAQCVTCTGTRDEFASYRKADGEGRHVKPYAELPATVRGAFGIGQVRDVVPSVETTTKQWTTAESAPDWCAETPKVERPPATEHVKGGKVPTWYKVLVRGATAPWADPNRFDPVVWMDQEQTLRNAGPTTTERIVRGLVITEDSGRKRGEVDVTAWRASAKHRSTYVSTFNMDDHIPAR